MFGSIPITVYNFFQGSTPVPPDHSYTDRDLITYTDRDAEAYMDRP
jgi:hypothetical protein